MKRADWEPERLPEEPMAWPELDRLVAAVADEHGVHVSVIRGRTRTKRVSAVRAEFCRRALEFGYSSVEVGAFLGRHHSTVLATDGRKRRVRVAA